MALLNFGDFTYMFGRVDRMMNNVMQTMGMHSNMSMNMGMPMADPFQMMNEMSMVPTMAPFGGTSSFHQHHHVTPSMQSFSMSTSPAAHASYSHFSSSMVTSDPYGRPQIYETSSSSRSAPGGVKETRSSVRDSRTGVHQMSIGHHLNERAHVRQRARNYYTGEEEHNDDYINLDETEAPAFNNEWQQRAQRYGVVRDHQRHRAIRSASPPIEVLAITSANDTEPQPIIEEPDDEPSPVRPPRSDKKSRSKRDSKSKPYKKRARTD